MARTVRDGWRVLREEGVVSLVRKTGRLLVDVVVSVPLFRWLLGSVGQVLFRARNQQRYATYRQEYDVDDSFVFAKPRTVFTGRGEISVGGGGHVGGGSLFEAAEGTRITVGEFARIGNNVRIYTSNNVPDQNLNAPNSEIQKRSADVDIGDGVWLGDNVVVTPGTTIGDNVVVGANAVVTSDVPDDSVFGGVPARKISDK
mgnify:CR=1 FL=1